MSSVLTWGGESLTHLAGVLRSTSTQRVMTEGRRGVVEGTNTSTTRPHSYLTRRSTLTDTFVTYRKREPDLMTRPGKAAHIGPLVWLSLSSTSAPRTTLHNDAPVHSFSALHPSSHGPDDGRGVPIVTT
ncbi:hypothetical protein J6590_049045 [Homalodisca vitripennis]|nr:hypothetical protein J6590_049045 [Homalodisca vitripennis]